MKFIDLQQQYERIQPEINARIQDVLSHGQFIMGPEILELEQRLADWVGVKHCVALASGTTALQAALMAVGTEPGDEVITPAFSFFATGEVPVLMGAKPVFVDIDPKTYNLDAALLEAAITPKTKAIIPVSLYGQCPDMDAIQAIAAAHGIPVIEDAAQSFGATYKGRQSGGLSEIGCASFFPAKPLGCYGDGGACFTNDDHFAELMRSFINHGQETRYHHTRIGINGRFDTLQAAILLPKLDIFADELEKRQQVARWYDTHLPKGKMVTPYIESYNISAYAQYTVRVSNRDDLRSALDQRGIPTAVHYPKPLHQQPAIKPYLSDEAAYPASELAADQVMSLPFHPYLTEDAVKQIANALAQCLGE